MRRLRPHIARARHCSSELPPTSGPATARLTPHPHPGRPAGLLSGVAAVHDVALAYRQVESGQYEDHPKQAALQRVLKGIDALTPVRLLLCSCGGGAPWPVACLAGAK